MIISLFSQELSSAHCSKPSVNERAAFHWGCVRVRGWLSAKAHWTSDKQILRMLFATFLQPSLNHLLLHPPFVYCHLWSKKTKNKSQFACIHSRLGFKIKSFPRQNNALKELLEVPQPPWIEPRLLLWVHHIKEHREKETFVKSSQQFGDFSPKISLKNCFPLTVYTLPTHGACFRFDCWLALWEQGQESGWL